MDAKTLFAAVLLTITTPFLSSMALGEQVSGITNVSLSDEKKSPAKTLAVGNKSPSGEKKSLGKKLAVGCTTGAVVGAPMVLGIGAVIGCGVGALISLTL